MKKGKGGADNKQTVRSKAKGWEPEAGDAWRKRSGNLIAVLLALSIAAVGLFAGVRAFLHTRAKPLPNAAAPLITTGVGAPGVDLLIPGTDVPMPPALFDGTNDSGLLIHGARPPERHLFFGLETLPDGSALPSQASLVLQYYKDQMTRLGWTLLDESPQLIPEDEVNGFPPGAVGAGQDWQKDGVDVLVHVETWNQWTEAWNLNLLISIGFE